MEAGRARGTGAIASTICGLAAGARMATATVGTGAGWRAATAMVGAGALRVAGCWRIATATADSFFTRAMATMTLGLPISVLLGAT